MPEAVDFPRVLFITPHAFNKVTGTGITFTNLFLGWPKDRIATVHDDTLPVATDVCDTYYRLSSDEIRKFGGFSKGKNEPHTGLEAGTAPTWPKALQAVKTFVFGDGLPQHGVLTSKLEKWINDFRPDVIYTILGSNGLMDIVEQVERKFGVPMVVHIMDDWMSGAFRKGLLGPLQRRRMLGSVHRIVEKSSLRLGICDAMCDAYSERFGVSFQAFQNVVDTQAVARYATDSAVVNDPVRIVYAGSVFAYAQRQSLIECCQAIQALASEDISVQLKIYCPPSHIAGMEERFIVGPAINLHGPLTDDTDFFSTICNADILLIPVNFDRKSVDFIRYSMPTRVPAYLASGTPILVYGPSTAAQVQYADAAGWGLVTGNRDIDSLKEAMTCLIKDHSLRERLSAEARTTALTNHDMKFIHKKFQASLAMLVTSLRDNNR